MSMNEIAIEDRLWRLHPHPVSRQDAKPEDHTTSSTENPTARGARWLARLPALIRLCTPARGFETTLGCLTADWEKAQTPGDVEASFLERLRSFAPAGRFDLVRGTELPVVDPSLAHRWSRRLGEIVVEIPLRCAGTSRDRLRIYHRAWWPGRLSSRTLGRIRLLCEMASRARESLRPRADCPWEESTAVWRDDARQKADWNREPEPPAQSSLIRDATFLSAILPFAIAQAKRHREPLSILCIAIDRLAGVKDLLGRSAADRTITMVGEVSASMIRTSDIVCRLDDDRMLVVLPRAAGEDAVHIAQSIRHALAARAEGGEAGLGLTVSIGVAAYPTCANNVFSLFDAVDLALERAQKLGRDQVALAPILAPPPESPASTPADQPRPH